MPGFNIKMNKLILGTAQFGLNYGINNLTGKPSKEQVFEILDFAIEHGITILDTADAYGNASDILGEYNAINPGTFVINTKFESIGVTLSEQLKRSLIKLQTNHINVLFYHSYNDFINIPLIQKELEELKKRGKIAKIGLSIYDNKEFRAAIDSEVVDVIQFPFNLLDNRSKRDELIRLAKVRNKELHVRSMFLQGLLLKSIQDLPSNLLPLKPYLKRIHKIAGVNNIDVEQLALTYALHQDEIDYFIIGIDNLQQLERSINAIKYLINEEAIEAINEINVKEVSLLYPKNW